jgi:hypothetical protein
MITKKDTFYISVLSTLDFFIRAKTLVVTIECD